jgi:hypothetical protein
MKENMFCPKINQLEKENSCWEEESLSLNSKPEDLKVIFNVNSAPGPGTYRLPSDFGQYDEILKANMNMTTGDFGKTGRTTSTSHQGKRD